MSLRSASPALAGLLLLLSIAMTACAALSSPGSLPTGTPDAEGPGVSPFGGGDGAGCGDPGSAESGTPTGDPSPAACEPASPLAGDPDAVVTSPPLDPNASFPSEPQAGLVKPVSGVIDPRPVAVDVITGAVEGDHLIARLEWISGVEPCYSLSTVLVEHDGSTFTLTPMEGSTARDVACIDIAVYKATLVDLGILPAGVYALQAGEGSAPPVTVTVP